MVAKETRKTKMFNVKCDSSSNAGGACGAVSESVLLDHLVHPSHASTPMLFQCWAMSVSTRDAVYR